MPQLVYSTPEFIELHGGPSVWLPKLGRYVLADGSSLTDSPLGPEQLPPPIDDHQRLSLQYARAVELVERAYATFTELYQAVYSWGADRMIPQLEQLRDEHTKVFTLMNDLHQQLMDTPREQQKAKDAKVRREAEGREFERQGKARTLISEIRLVSEATPDSQPKET